MRIGIDGQALYLPRTGVGRYVFEQCRALDELLPEATFLVYSHGPIELPVAGPRWIVRRDRPWRWPALAWLKLRCPWLLRNDDLDVFWGTTGFLPRVPRGVRRLATVYDFIHRVCPETLRRLGRLGFSLFYERDLRRADTLVAISQGTSQRCEQFCGRPADLVVEPDLAPIFRHLPDPASGCALRESLGLLDPFVLCVATSEPRKNLDTLMAAWNELEEKGSVRGYRLALVGKNVPASYLTPSVLGLGYRSDAELACLYQACHLFVLPSIYEGFGIPLREARACGARNLLSADIPEMREAGGPGAFYVRPDKDGIREGLLAALAATQSLAPYSYRAPDYEALAGAFRSLTPPGRRATR